MAGHWNLVADIGGTNARFAVVDAATKTISVVRRYSVTDHENFIDAVAHFLRDVSAIAEEWQPVPQSACLALACPVSGDHMRFTNSSWFVDRQQISTLLGHAAVDLINDFAAVGYAVTDLLPEDSISVNVGVVDASSPIVVLGPGTGLGVATVVPLGSGYRVLGGEGGHVDFSPVNKTEILVLQYLSEQFGRVSAERICSGMGIENLYRALAAITEQPALYQNAAEISAAAVTGDDPLAVESLNVFCDCLGSIAGNLALTLGAKGGVYIAGGIIPRFVDFFLASGFYERLLSKGRFRDYLVDIPVELITKDNLGLAGAVTKMKQSEF